MKGLLIIKGKEKVKAKIQDDGYGIDFYTTRSGWQWTGQGMTPELAKLSIQVLQEYLDGSPESALPQNEK